MNRLTKHLVVGSMFAFGLALTPAMAQHEGHGHGGMKHGEKAGHSHERAESHGGTVTMSKEFHVETVFMPDQVRLYLYDGDQNPMHFKHWEKGLVDATGVVEYRDRGRGTTTLKFKRGTPDGYACTMCAAQESTKPGECPECGMALVKSKIPDGTLWSCPMHPDENGKAAGKCSDCGMKFMPQDYLVAAASFGGLKAGDARVTFNLKNLPGKSEKTLQFAEKYMPAKMGGMHKKGEHGHGDHGGKGHGGHGGKGHGDHDH